MAFDEAITKGTTSKILEVMLRDSSTGFGKTGVAFGDVTASYCREGATRQAITLAAGSPGDAYSSGKWAEVDGANMRGVYQIHLPDAMFAPGVNAVTLTLQASGVIDCRVRVLLIDANLRDGASLGLTRLDAKVGDVPAAILATPANLLATDGEGRVTVGNNTDKTGYSLAADQSGVTVGTVNGLGATAQEQVNTQADQALTDYDAPTNAEMVARTRPSAEYALETTAGATRTRVETALPNAAPSADTGLPTTADLTAVTDLLGTPAGASLSADVAAVAAAVGAGGARAISVQVRTPDGDPVPLCRVWIASVVSLNTDTAGDATLHLDDGAYVLHLYAPSYEAFEPVALVVAGDATVTYALTPITVTPATDPSLCHVQGYARTLDGELRAAHQLTFELIVPMGTRALMDGAALLERRTPQRPVSDADGLFDFTLERTDTLSVAGCVWRVSSSLAGFNGVEFELAQASATLAELLLG